MFHKVARVVFFITSIVFFSAVIQANEIAATSEIPEKRDFPLNEKVNPCHNFHQYVCSRAESAFKLRDDRSRHTFAFNDSSERILKAKMDFFAHIEKQKKLTARALQVKNNYLACMDAKAGATNESEAVKKLITDINAIQNTSDFQKFQIEQFQSGRVSLLYLDAYSNQDNPKINDLYIFTEFMNLPEHSYYDNKELVSEYQKLISEFFKIAQPELTEAERKLKAEKIIQLERDFIKVFPLPEVRRQRWAQKRQETQEQFVNKYPNLALKEFFTKKLPKKTLIANPLPEALEFYNQNLTAEQLSTFKDFVIFSTLYTLLDDSAPEYFEKVFTFNHKYIGGPPKRSDRAERCTRKTMYAFPKELDQILMAELFPRFPAAKFKSVASRIRSSMIAGLEKNTWLEPATKAKAILKVKKAKMYLVKPETPRQWDFLEVKKYTTDNRIENGRIYSQANFEKKMKSLKVGANLEAWEMGPLTVNAYYDPSANKFVMPMGILQYPFFNPDGDLIENLGAVGAVIGHELGHGIDDQGSRYDESGKVNQWMTMNDLKEFTSRGSRLVEQFNKVGHNGQLTLGENIGDLVGLSFAYQAAFPAGKKATVEDQQRLFIAYARLWCGVALPKAEEQQLKTDPHALGWARINEQVKHQPAFSQAFSCKAGDAMTLPQSEQVTIW